MKLFILLFTFLCFTHTQAKAVNQDKLVELGNCKTYTVDATGKITGCTTCYDGFKLTSGKCVFDTTNVYPAHNCNTDGTCQYYNIGYDGAAGTCSQNVPLVNVEGNQTGTSTCLACAKFKSNNQCEKCATGYILRENSCVPLSINPFGEADPSNEYCIHGIYDGSAICYACNDKYKVNVDKCVVNEQITQNIMEGCILAYTDGTAKFVCKKCRDGYVLDTTNNICKKLPKDQCIEGIYDEDKEGYRCTKCMPGYSSPNDECTVCTLRNDVLSNQFFNGDECNLLETATCEQCNPNCEKDSSKLMCFSKHCDLFDSSNKCIRCEQGYVLDGNGKCLFSEDCRNIDTGLCEKGYYEDVDGSNVKSCKKCEGSCIECYSADICKEGYSTHTSGYSLNGLPCFDPNCDLCSSTNTHICLKCKTFKGDDPLAETLTLIKGRCYVKRREISINTAETYQACRFFKEPDFSSNSATEITGDKLDGSYIRQLSVAFEHTNNPSGLCNYNDLLPYYFQHDGDVLKCAGANRDENNDCECKEGYYATDIHKFSDCVKYTKDPNCAKPLNADVCGKCKEGLKMTHYKDGDNVVFECGCDEGYRVVDGKCVPCPENCKSCRTNGDKIQCFSCKGYITVNTETYIQNNYNRDLNNQCECKVGYAAQQSSDTRVYACHEIPKSCPDSYIAGENNIRCTNCPKEGFDYSTNCASCLNGYYLTGQGDSAICNKCPVIEGTDVTGCSSCSIKSGQTEPTCDSCVDGYLDQTNNCKSCKEGTSLRYKEGGIGSSAEPFCVVCNRYCPKEAGKDGCFISIKGSDENNNNKTLGSTPNNPYTLEFVESEKNAVFCNKCSDETKSVWLGCECDDGYIRDEEFCRTCVELSQQDPYKNLDLSLCDLNNGNCELDLEADVPFKCKKCLAGYEGRSISSNCLRCTSSKQYPVSKDTPGSIGGCMNCPDHCDNCDSADKCKTCPQVGEIGLIVGDKCDECTEPYFKDGTTEKNGKKLIKCVKCDDSCQSCFGNPKNCSKCIDSQHHLPSETNACNQCVKGYFFNPLDGDCLAVSTDIGILESEAACKMSDGSIRRCEDVVKQNLQNDVVGGAFERAVKCDTTIKGVAAEPVDGYCTCKRGFFDNRKPEEIEADRRPQCTDVRHLTGDDFCIHAEKKADGKFECKQCNAEYLELKDGECVCKDGYYTTSWGSCVPCDRHIQGCKKCKKCEKGKECPDDTELDCLEK